MTKEALKMALEALEAHADIGIKSDKVITAIKEALAQPEHGWTPERIAGIARLKDAQDKKLAQPEQEPVEFEALWDSGPTNKDYEDAMRLKRLQQLTTPPQRKPLTDEELKKIWYDIKNIMGWYSFQEIARVIEVAHGIKGEA